MNILKLTDQEIESLPEEIDLVGVGLTRAAFLNEKPLLPEASLEHREYSDTFMWGIYTHGTKQLALAVLLASMPSHYDAILLGPTFATHFLAKVDREEVKPREELPTESPELMARNGIFLSGNNFHLKIKLKAWYEAIKEERIPEDKNWFNAYAENLPLVFEDAELSTIDAISIVIKNPENPLLGNINITNPEQ